jgi:hypothetical protein
MAMVDHSQSGFREFARTAGGTLTLLCAIATILLLLGWIVVAIDNDSNIYPAFTATLVFAGAVCGGLIGTFLARKIDPDFRDSNFTSTVQRKLDRFEDRKDFFLGIVSAFTCIYLIGLLVAISRFPNANGGWPLPLLVTVVTIATIGYLMFFAIRYASFVKMLVALGAMIDERPSDPRAHPIALIDSLRASVFRDEQLYEPPGNIFVTMGITATFLGLAVGLATLDLTAVATTSGTRDLSTLSSFIGCMGLALGISMLGVVIAMAAQWLRGHGPSLATDLVLERALREVEAGSPASAATS